MSKSMKKTTKTRANKKIRRNTKRRRTARGGGATFQCPNCYKYNSYSNTGTSDSHGRNYCKCTKCGYNGYCFEGK